MGVVALGLREVFDLQGTYVCALQHERETEALQIGWDGGESRCMRAWAAGTAADCWSGVML